MTAGGNGQARRATRTVRPRHEVRAADPDEREVAEAAGGHGSKKAKGATAKGVRALLEGMHLIIRGAPVLSRVLDATGRASQRAYPPLDEAPAPSSDRAPELPLRILSVTTEPLEVPLVDPFVIATARVVVTQSVLVRVELEERGSRVMGLGEAASFQPVTREGPADVHAAVRGVAPALLGRTLAAPTVEGFAALVGGALDGTPAARAGLQVALLDAMARAEGRHLVSLLDPAIALPRRFISDVTLPMLPIGRMVALADQWRARGFRTFKVKVGRDLDEDREALLAVARRVPEARFRLDANAGFTVADAVALLRACVAAGLHIECFEQPCAREDMDGLEAVQASVPGVPVVADESLRGQADLDAILARRGRIGGVNLKIVKLGGILEAQALGRRARAAGLLVMVGGMVETRLGMSTGACLAACFDEVLADLDTAWLLIHDPFTGGYEADGEVYQVGRGTGHGVSLRPGPSSPMAAT